MPPMVRVVDALHASLPPDDDTSDRSQLERFLTHRDEAAFAELVRRHGPMVFGIARRILGNCPDADDAFQATFMVLARKAGSLRSFDMVRSWLYSVAVKTAHKARQQAIKRKVRTMAAAKPEAIPATIPNADTWAIIEAELAALPEQLRQVFLTCDVGGQSRSQAAQSLGWPEGTVAKRLTKVRAELAKRLTQRGITLSIGAVATVLAVDAKATVPVELFGVTVRQGVAFGLGTEIASPSVQILAEKVMIGLKASTLKMWIGAGLFLTLLGGGLMWAGPDQQLPPAKKNDPIIPVNEKPKDDAAKRWKAKEMLTFKDWLAGSLAYSTDGKLLVVGGTGGQVSLHDASTLTTIWTTKLNADYSAVTFHQGATFVAATVNDGAVLLDTANGKIRHTIVEKGCNPTQIAAFPTKQRRISETESYQQHQIVFGHARGYFVKTWPNDKVDNSSTIETSTLAKGKPVLDALAIPLAVDPAGRSVIMTGPLDTSTNKNVLWAYAAGDYSEGSPGNRLMTGHEGRVVSAAWSSDGTTAITGDDQGRVILWNTKTMKELRRIELTGRVVGTALAADGTTAALAVVQDRRGVVDAYLQEVYIWDTTKVPEKLKPIVTTFQQHFGPCHAALAFKPDRRELAYCFANPAHLQAGQPIIGEVRILQWGESPPANHDAPKPVPLEWKVQPTISDPEFDLHDVAIAPDGKSFAINTNHARTFVYSLPDNKRLFTVHGQFPHWINNDLWTWTDKMVVTDRTTGKPTATHEINNAKLESSFGAFDTNGQRIVLFNGSTFVIHARDGMAPVSLDSAVFKSVKQPDTFVARGLSWSPDGTKIAAFFPAGDRACGLGVWDARNGKLLAHTLRNAERWTANYACLAWTPNSKQLAIGGFKGDGQQNSSVVLLDPTTLQVNGTLDAKISSRDGGADVTALAVAADNRTIAVAVNLHTGRSPLTRVLLLDSHTGDIGQHLMTNIDTPPITRVAITADQRTIIASTGSLPINAPANKEILHRVVIWQGQPTGN